ncbi:hypothetical protein NE237_029186 [Protea cynaroides]|uniref:Uncharacterized protein n=1 Tax=Protea cynaroides TaxID=273540 RepID=A0A9Q0JTK0_9MAGN|nr:hypothetical protein NE237_029186 [Protea cynaroides]
MSPSDYSFHRRGQSHAERDHSFSLTGSCPHSLTSSGGSDLSSSSGSDSSSSSSSDPSSSSGSDLTSNNDGSGRWRQPPENMMLCKIHSCRPSDYSLHNRGQSHAAKGSLLPHEQQWRHSSSSSDSHSSSSSSSDPSSNSGSDPLSNSDSEIFNACSH